MFCYKCGNEIPDSAKFCHKCGTRIAASEATSLVEEPETKPQWQHTRTAETQQDSTIKAENTQPSFDMEKGATLASKFKELTPAEKALFVAVCLLAVSFAIFIFIKATWLAFLVLAIGGGLLYARKKSNPTARKLSIVLLSGAGIIAAIFIIISGTRLIGGDVDGVSDYLDSDISSTRGNSNYSSGRNYNSDRNSSIENRYDFEWVSEPKVEAEYIGGEFYGGIYVDPVKMGDKIVGTIKNVTNETFSLVTITFILYDSTGNQIDTAIASITNFRPSNTWKFEAHIWNSKASRFEFDKITAY